MDKVAIYNHIYKFWLFCLIKEYGNFKEAANHARITQSALSQNISALESLLECTLLVRERGSVQLTNDGSRIFLEIEPILKSISDLDFTQDTNQNLKGKLKIGAYESIAIDFIPALFSRFKSSYPEMKLDIQTSRSEYLVKKVRSGDLDMALVVNGVSDSKTEVLDLSKEYLGIYACSKAVKANKIGESSEGKFKYSYATLSAMSDGQPLYYKKFIKEIPKEFEISLTCDSFETIRSLILSCALCGLLPSKIANRTPGDFVKVWPEDQSILDKSEHKMTLVYRKNIDMRFVNIIEQELKKLIE